MLPTSTEYGLYLRRLNLLMSIRLLLAGVGIFVIILSRYRVTLPLAEIQPKVYLAYYLLLTVCIVNLFYLLIQKIISKAAEKKVSVLKKFAIIQIFVDIILIAILVYLTGGVDSIFAYLFFAAILAGAMLISARASLFLASTATVCLCMVNILYYLHKAYGIGLPLLSPEITERFDRRLSFLLPYLFFFSLSLHIVAILAGRLAIELERVKIFTDEIIQHMADGVIAVDKNCKIAFINNRIRDFLGIKEPIKSLLGKYCSEIPGIASCPELVAELSSEHKKTPAELLIKAHDGEDRLVEMKSSLLYDEQDRFRGVVTVLIDMSMKLKMEKAVKHAEMLQALSEMSAGMAHEIRNPLSSIRGAAQELAASEQFSSNDKKLLTIIVKESDRLNSIISNFFEYAKRKTVKFSSFNLSQTLDEVSTLLEKRENTPVKVLKDFPPKMEFYGNSEQLKQAILNLGINAVEASKPGSTVTIRSFYSKMPADTNLQKPSLLNGLIVEVSDTGSGIDPAIYSKIYTPFFTTKTEGTGLGLAIADKIIRSHNGNITIQSQLNKGTVVSIWLPLQK